MGEKKGHVSLADNELTLSSCVRKKENSILMLEIIGQAFPQRTGAMAAHQFYWNQLVFSPGFA